MAEYECIDPGCSCDANDPWKARHDVAAALAALAEAWSRSIPLPWMEKSTKAQFDQTLSDCADDLRALLADPAAVLADRDRRIKAEVWDEGWNAGWDERAQHLAPIPNPYREGGRA